MSATLTVEARIMYRHYDGTVREWRAGQSEPEAAEEAGRLNRLAEGENRHWWVETRTIVASSWTPATDPAPELEYRIRLIHPTSGQVQTGASNLDLDVALEIAGRVAQSGTSPIEVWVEGRVGEWAWTRVTE